MEWISVKDNYPRAFDKVLVLCKSGVILTAEYYETSEGQRWHYYNVAGTMIYMSAKHITHWAFKPEPPKE